MKKTLIILFLLLVGFSGSVYAEKIELNCKQTYYKTMKEEDSGQGIHKHVIINTNDGTLTFKKFPENSKTFDNLQTSWETYKIRSGAVDIEINRFTGFMIVEIYTTERFEYYHYTCSKTKRLF